jgi:hypothetical protein
MVTSRNSGSKAGSMKLNWETYLKDFGTIFTHNRFTKQFDSMGRETGVDTVSAVIVGDIQWVNKWNISHINAGDVEIGDGTIFVKVNSDIQLEDEIIYSGKTYRVTEQIEGEQVGGEIVYLGYVIKLNSSPD